MDALRRTPPQNFGGNNETSLESDRVVLVLGEPIDIVPQTDVDYPFPDAQKVEGKLKYYPEQLIDGMPSDPEEYDVTLRSGSNILLIHNVKNEQKVRELVGTTARSFDDLQLQRIAYNRKSLWSFIFSGRDQPHIVVRDYDTEQLLEYDDMKDLSEEELVQNHRLKSARIVFDYEDEEINVRYSDDVLSFLGDASAKGREYVIQLYEKYVVAGHKLERFK